MKVTTLVENIVLENLPSMDVQSDPGNGRSLYDRFHEVIGTVEELPVDLSENPSKYMHGFGETPV